MQTIQTTRRGIEIPKSMASLCARARDELTVAPLPTNAVPRPFRFPAYIDTPETLIVPGHWPPAHGLGKDVRSAGHTMDHLFVGTLRDDLEQPAAVDATLSSLRSKGGAVLSLAVGHGKTCCGLYIACALRAKTVIVVHKAFLADQWADRIRHFVPTATVSFVRGAACDTSGDFVIAMIQTLLSRSYPSSTFDPFSLLVFDEAHHVAAKVFSQVMFTLNVPYTLGLTATPTRKDGLERLLHYFLGPLSYTKSLHAQSAVTVHIQKYTCNAYATPPPNNARGDVDFTRLMTVLTKNTDRTARIADLIVTHLAGRHVLVLSHRRAHLEALLAVLTARCVDAALYVGGIKDVPSSAVILSTYAYVSEGFDEPRLDALVLATPASDVAQTVGRILRGNDPSKTPVIHDVVDQWSVCFAQAAKRRKQYVASGFVVR
jgi:superfamily II DNA or RNA helicase